MPLLQFYHPPGVFTDADKQSIAEGLVNGPYRNLPAFYVNVHFIELQPSNHYIGGKPRDNFVRVVIEHIALHTIAGRDDPKPVNDNIQNVIKPWMDDRGLDWEFCVVFAQNHMWRMNGYDPPLIRTADMEDWKAAGKPIPRKA